VKLDDLVNSLPHLPWGVLALVDVDGPRILMLRQLLFELLGGG